MKFRVVTIEKRTVELTYDIESATRDEAIAAVTTGKKRPRKAEILLRPPKPEDEIIQIKRCRKLPDKSK